jgi:hypothetical protein
MTDRRVALLCKKLLQLHSHLSRLPYPVSVLPAGNAPESFASGGGPAPPSRDRRSHGAGEVSSKGSPAATDERCVLDEHIATRPMPPGAYPQRQRVSGGAERTGTEIAGRAGVEAPVLFRIRTRLIARPSSRTTHDARPAKPGRMASHGQNKLLARPATGRGNDEAWPSSFGGIAWLTSRQSRSI